ncbi:Nucleotidyltransferase [Gymnopus androsaceus JB14]|uniref:polynucleotide adenylyltransferase n=1 Tax=Gymnopus androsaceus JB14 TaxID=1447944 RepID=A0A6A4GKK5_9AGAR|nr:Nucleotidyltransferase [Gymnopus androsaceus JB14]
MFLVELCLVRMQHLRPWIKSAIAVESRNAEERLHHDILAFTTYIRPTPAENLIRDALCDILFKFIKSAVKPDEFGSVELFGSHRIGLGLPGGDLDIVVTTTENCESHKDIAFALAKRLKSSGIVDAGKNAIEVNHFAPVPVIRCCSVARWGSIPIDISFAKPLKRGHQTSAVLVSSIIQTHLEAQPALAPLVLVLKCFLKQRRLESARSGGLGSYPLMVMVISFLQLNPTGLPSRFITHPFDEDVHSLGRLLTDFFLYYGRLFPYGEKYITIRSATMKSTRRDSVPCSSPSTSAVISRSDVLMDVSGFGSGSGSNSGGLLDSPAAAIAVEMEDGEINEDSEEDSVGGLKPSAGVPWIRRTPMEKIAIQCVVDQNDIGRGTGRMNVIARQFKYAAAILLEARNKDEDVLGLIVGLSQEAISHRAHIEGLVQSAMPTEKTASTELPSMNAKISSRRLRLISGLELATAAKKRKTRKGEYRERPSTELPPLTVKTSSRSWSRLSSASSEMSSHSREDLTVQSLSKAKSGR